MQKVIKLDSKYLSTIKNLFNAEYKELSLDQPLHWHDYFEIDYVMDGGGENIINGVSYPFSSNTLFLSNPIDFHEIKFTRTTRLLNIQFASELLFSNTYGLISKPIVYNDSDGFYYNYLKKIYEYSLSENRDIISLKNMLAGFIHLTLADKKNKSGSPERETADYFSSTLKYINEHFSEPLTLSKLAGRINIAPEYLSRLFHSQCGITLAKYIQSIRLKYAYNLIANTDIPIKDICLHSGFNSVSHFIRAFKSTYNVSPGALRK